MNCISSSIFIPWLLFERAKLFSHRTWKPSEFDVNRLAVNIVLSPLFCRLPFTQKFLPYALDDEALPAVIWQCSSCS